MTEAGVRVSGDGRGRWMDNVFIERLWRAALAGGSGGRLWRAALAGGSGGRLGRSMKYECVYLHAFETGSEARAGLGRWITCDNADRPPSALGGRTPAEARAGLPAGIGWAA